MFDRDAQADRADVDDASYFSAQTDAGPDTNAIERELAQVDATRPVRANGRPEDANGRERAATGRERVAQKRERPARRPVAGIWYRGKRSLLEVSGYGARETFSIPHESSDRNVNVRRPCEKREVGRRGDQATLDGGRA